MIRANAGNICSGNDQNQKQQPSGRLGWPAGAAGRGGRPGRPARAAGQRGRPGRPAGAAGGAGQASQPSKEIDRNTCSGQRKKSYASAEDRNRSKGKDVYHM